MSNVNTASVVMFQVRRGRATSGTSRDVTDYVAANGITTFDVVDGSNPSAAVEAVFLAPFHNGVTFIERCSEDSIPFLRAMAEKLGHTVAAFAVAAAPRQRLPLVSVAVTVGESESVEEPEPMLANA